MILRIVAKAPRAIFAAAIFAALGLIVFVVAAAAGPGVFEPLTVVTKKGQHAFQVEVMRSRDDRRIGMMYRRSLAPDKGMLFQFEADEVATFWMKNTYVPLDMIFIKADGTVQRVERNAEPLSAKTISSGAPVLGVLEVIAGTAERLGIDTGDRIEHPAFKPR